MVPFFWAESGGCGVGAGGRGVGGGGRRGGARNNIEISHPHSHLISP